MSTKTIAVDSRVYDRLASAKRSGESFSKLIDRLLTAVGDAHTGADILRGLETMPPLPSHEAEAFLSVIEESRTSEVWSRA